MRLIGNGFSSLGIEVLKNALSSDCEWISIDEIGYLESQCEDYLHAIANIMNKKHVIAVVRKQNLSHLQNLCKRDDVFLIDLDEPFGNIGCVIMASGHGKRFGSNKLMASFHDVPLISHILDTTEHLFPNRIVVTRHQDIASLCADKNINFILHNFPHRNDTIRLGLERLLDTEQCIFCTADQPLLTQDTLSALALLSANAPQKIVRPIFEEAPGSPVIFPKWTYEELLHLPEKEGGGYLIKKHPNSVLYLPLTNSAELEDVDTIEDLIKIENLQQKSV